VIQKQIENMQPTKLGYLAGLLSSTLGLRRTTLALDALNSVPDVAADQREYFRRFICILGIAVTDTQWDQAIEVLQRTISTQEVPHAK
jgi:hypothetical protein